MNKHDAVVPSSRLKVVLLSLWVIPFFKPIGKVSG